jgi:hypothetical protein
VAAELKTKQTKASVAKFLAGIKNKSTKDDCHAVLTMMQKATKAEPKMWGTSIVGFGSYHYKYASGREGDWFQVGFSPRKQNLTVYLMGGLSAHEGSPRKLGKYKTGKGCLYFKSLTDIDTKVLNEMIKRCVAEIMSNKST